MGNYFVDTMNTRLCYILILSAVLIEASASSVEQKGESKTKVRSKGPVTRKVFNKWKTLLRRKIDAQRVKLKDQKTVIMTLQKDMERMKKKIQANTDAIRKK